MVVVKGLFKLGANIVKAMSYPLGPRKRPLMLLLQVLSQHSSNLLSYYFTLFEFLLMYIYFACGFDITYEPLAIPLYVSTRVRDFLVVDQVTNLEWLPLWYARLG